MFCEGCDALPGLCHSLLMEKYMKQQSQLILSVITDIVMKCKDNSLLLSTVLQDIKKLLQMKVFPFDHLISFYRSILFWNGSILTENRDLLNGIIEEYRNESFIPNQWSVVQIQLNDRIIAFFNGENSRISHDYSQQHSNPESSSIRSRIPSSIPSPLPQSPLVQRHIQKPSSFPLYILLFLILLTGAGLVWFLQINGVTPTKPQHEYVNYDSPQYMNQVKEVNTVIMTPSKKEPKIVTKTDTPIQVTIREEPDAFVIEDVDLSSTVDEPVQISEPIISQDVIDLDFSGEDNSPLWLILFIIVIICLDFALISSLALIVLFWRFYAGNMEVRKQSFSTPIKVNQFDGLPPPITPFPDSISFSQRRNRM